MNFQNQNYWNFKIMEKIFPMGKLYEKPTLFDQKIENNVVW